MALLNTPATTQAAQKAASTAGVGRSAAPPSTNIMVQASKPAAEPPRAQGSTPTALESSAATATSAKAICSAAVREAAVRIPPALAGANTAITAPHRASAAAWLNRVGDGGRL